MGRDGLGDASHDCILLDHNQNHGTSKMSTPAIEENIVFLTRFDIHLITVAIPGMQFIQCLLRDRNQPFFVSLSQYTNEFLLLKKIAQLKIDKLAHTQATREEYLNNGFVALSDTQASADPPVDFPTTR